MIAITTHVLDLAHGRAAQGVPVVLEYKCPDGSWVLVGARDTDADGRVRDFYVDGHVLAEGVHRLTFALSTYFAKVGERCFFPQACLEFEVFDATQHHHVPLLVSPYGYSTYRGS
ncbi:MAG: hydroxyisourate hydrolase [Candidatus Eisenbacteria bacterium]